MSGIYKSRLFNFLNRQKIRFSHQLGITLRHLQLATETGVQILLYPVYIIARTSISLRQQLKSHSQSSANHLRISSEKISSDDNLWLDNDNNNLAIENRKANVSPNSTVSQKVNSELSRPRQDNSRTIAPIRLFQKMLDWVQTSPVATNLNLFGEASIVPASPVRSLTDASANSLNSSLSVNQTVSQPEKNSFFSNLFHRLGLLFSNRSHISNTESSAQESFAIQVLIRRAIAYFFGNKQQLLSGKKQEALPGAESQVNLPVVNSSQSETSQFSLLSQVTSWLEKVKSTIVRPHSLTTESSEQGSFAIQVLIRRAIAYFFGSKQQLLSGKKQEALPGAESQVNLPVVNSSQSETSQFSLLSQVTSWLEKVKLTISRPHGLTTESSKQESFAIQVLIRRAITYFFGNKQQLLSGKNQEVLPGTESPESLMTQLSQANVSVVNYARQKELKSSLLSKLNSWLNKARSTDSHAQSLTNISSAEDSSCLVITANFPPTSTTEQQSLTVNSDFNDSLLTDIPLELSSDLWEAEVVTVGYVKNILERILEVLDKITWWIEKHLVKLWQFFKKIFKRVIKIKK